MSSSSALGDEIAALAAQLEAGEYRLITKIGEFDARGGYAHEGALSCAHWLSYRVGLGLGPAREKVAAKEWAAAVDALMLVRNDSNADWHNLMGLALRNLPAADFAVAEFHYAEALRINPAHRGAMEYLGELYLQTGRRAQAEAQLAALARACPAGCPELSDLKAALAKARP